MTQLALINEKAAEYRELQNSVSNLQQQEDMLTPLSAPADTRKYVIGAFEMLFTKREDRPVQETRHGLSEVEHMNQMLKKASTTCAAFACAASLMFSGAAVVWADGEIDETVKNQIETYAEGLTDEIIGLSDDQIEQYMESDDAFTSSAMTAWDRNQRRTWVS